MHWTTHIVTGAAWGYLLERPALAAVCGFLGHLVLDVVPHHDPGREVGYLVDAACGTAVLSCLAFSGRVRSQVGGNAALWGAFGACLPDFELLLKLVKDIENEQLLFPAHNETFRHRETHALASNLIQGTMITCSVLPALVKLRRGLRRASAVGESGG